VATAGLDNFTGGGEASATMAAGVPMGRLGHVDEIADVIKFLTSAEARFITGQIIAVNGGKTAL
jgi:NAD(P)-dependent dehydrogenase (short-subunit alcohol dehydrogenase family)